jgi:hypothetical protein
MEYFFLGDNMETFGDNLVAKSGIFSESKFYCDNCDYKCFKKYNWEKHLLTAKHKKQASGDKGDKKVAKVAEKWQIKEKEISCKNCGKPYSSRNGLWKHSKMCDQNNKSDISDKEMIIMLLKQNTELFKSSININTTNSNNTNHSNNKTFNLQFFLNEECKDALNIGEFVSSIKVELEDLEATGRLGYVEGISRIIKKNLHELDKTKRPIHCSDVKREVLYIKNENQWVKENDPNKPVLTKAIKQIANENIKQINEWRMKHPDCLDPDSKKNDEYLNIVSNAMSESTVEEQLTNYEKIITKVAKEVIIEK